MAGRKMGPWANGQHGAKSAGIDAPGEQLDEFDLAQDIKGKNALHGRGQGAGSSERQAMADEKGETDGLIESFEKLDKNVRAKTDLGKRGG